MQQNLVNRLAGLPGVSSVSLINGLPMTGFSSQDPISASDHTYAADRSRRCAASSASAPGTFQLLGTPLSAGREFTLDRYP